MDMATAFKKIRTAVTLNPREHSGDERREIESAAIDAALDLAEGWYSAQLRIADALERIAKRK